MIWASLLDCFVFSESGICHIPYFNIDLILVFILDFFFIPTFVARKDSSELLCKRQSFSSSKTMLEELLCF